MLSKLENFATWRTWYFFSIGKQIYYLLIKGHKKVIHHNFRVCMHTINIKWWVYVLIIKQIIIVIYYYSMRKTKLLTSAFIFWVNLIGILISVKVLLGVAWYWISMATIFILSIYTHLAIWMRKEHCWQIWWCQDEDLETIGKDFFKEKLKFLKKKTPRLACGGIWWFGC